MAGRKRHSVDGPRCFVARIHYQYPHDVKEDAPKNGSLVHVRFGFRLEEPSIYKGQIAYTVAESGYWLPECDLLMLRNCTHEEFMAHMKVIYTEVIYG